MKAHVGINHKTVSAPGHLLLFDLKKNRFRSRFYQLDAGGDQLSLGGRNPKGFYRELTALLTLRVNDVNSLFCDDAVLLSGREPETGNGWELYIDPYGYLRLRGTGEYGWLQINSRLSLSCFAGKSFQVGFAWCCHPWSGQKPYHLRLLGSSRLGAPLQVLASTGVPSHLSAILPEGGVEVTGPHYDAVCVPASGKPGVKMPFTPIAGVMRFPRLGVVHDGVAVTSISAWNTSRYQLFTGRTASRPACRLDRNFPGGSLAFSFYHPEQDVLEVFTGPGFHATVTYWLFVRVIGATAGKTAVRVHFDEQGLPNMHPVLFYSLDGRRWHRTRTVEASSQENVFDPLILAPAKSFYLSTAIPFLTEDVGRLKAAVKDNPMIEVTAAGASGEGREITLFRVTDPSVNDKQKKHLAIIVGQHTPQEMMGGHFLAPMIAYLLKRPELLKKMVLHFVPIVNVDCAYWSSSGMVGGYNPNRCWATNSQMASRDITDYSGHKLPPDTKSQPENRGIKDYFGNLKRRGIGLDMFLDIHAGGTFRNHPIFVRREEAWKTFAGSRAPEMSARHDRLVALLEEHAGLRSVDAAPDWTTDAITASGYFQKTFPQSISLTLELSTSSYFNPVLRKTRVFDQDSLEIVGEGILKAFLAYVELARF